MYDVDMTLTFYSSVILEMVFEGSLICEAYYCGFLIRLQILSDFKRWKAGMEQVVLLGMARPTT